MKILFYLKKVSLFLKCNKLFTAALICYASSLLLMVIKGNIWSMIMVFLMCLAYTLFNEAKDASENEQPYNNGSNAKIIKLN